MISMNEAGQHHAFDNSKNQDAVLTRDNKDFAVLVLADGVSACSCGAQGARISCETAAQLLLSEGNLFFHLEKHEAARKILAAVYSQLRAQSRLDGMNLDDYASTLMCVLIDKYRQRLFYFSVGDGMIAATKDGSCCLLAMPGDSRGGCCVTTTIEAESLAKVGVSDVRSLRSVVLLSDGAWRIMYNRNRMLPQIRQILIDRRYEDLRELLFEKERFDDCSFIAADLTKLYEVVMA